MAKYQAREQVEGWQVYVLDDSDQVVSCIGFAPTIEEAEGLIAADVAQRNAPAVIREYDSDGKPIEG